MKYGDYDVNLYTGTPNISIPLHSHQGREMALPVALTYDASGIKVGQLATSAGLGWNLQVGGRISRITNGAPDDYIQVVGTYHTIWDNLPSDVNTSIAATITNYVENNRTFNSAAAAEDYLDFLRDVDKGLIDAQPDFFSVNAPGVNAFFVINIDPAKGAMTPRVLNNPRMKVEILSWSGNSISSWKVYNEDGTIYTFAEAETIRTEENDYGQEVDLYGLEKEYNSSWVLTKIQSPNGLDTYDFTYTTLPATEEGLLPVGTVVETNSIDPDDGITSYPLNSGSVTQFQPLTTKSRKLVDDIEHNNRTIIDFSFKSRTDYAGPASALDEMTAYDNGVLKKVVFKHSYFGNNDGRLKLDTLEFRDEAGNAYGHEYIFDYYHASLVPPVTSLSRDYMGYYNGALNSSLIPKYVTGDKTFVGADRSPDFSKSIYGTLSSITYPTGGHTDFDYEAHVFSGDVDYVSSIQNIDFLIVEGGAGDIAECGPSCQDIWGLSPPPKIEKKVVEIQEDKDYVVDLNLVDPNGVAYLHRLPDANSVTFENISSLQQIGYWFNNNPVSETVSLQEGYYQITMVNSLQGAVSTFYLGEEVTTQVPSANEKAGHRIKTIRNYDEADVFQQGKEYIYGDGQTLDYPTLITSFQVKGGIVTSHPEPINFVVRSATASDGGNRPHVVYQDVKVVERGDAADFGSPIYKNGYTDHTYRVGYSGWQNRFGINSYFGEYADGGKEIQSKTYKTTTFDDNPLAPSAEYEMVIDQAMGYQRLSGFGQSAIHATVNNNFYAYVPLIYESDTVAGIYRINRTPTGKACVTSPTEPISLSSLDDCPAIIVNPGPCYDPGKQCYGVSGASIASDVALRVGSLDMGLSIASGYYDYVYTTSRTSKSSGTNLIETTTSRLSDDAYGLLRSQTRTKSNGLTDSVTYYYPTDGALIAEVEPVDTTGQLTLNSNSNYSALVTDNQLNKVVQSERYEVDEQGSSQLLNTYRLNYQNTTYPSSRSLATGAAPLEVREIYSYSNGNIREAETIDLPGVKQTFIYSYDHRFLVAHVINADYTTVKNKIESTSSVTVGQLQSSYYTEATLLSHLDGLYELTGAQVTLYLHKPGRGVSQVIDQNQRKTKYEYDEVGRLKRVVDHEGHVLSQNVYNYGN